MSTDNPVDPPASPEPDPTANPPSKKRASGDAGPKQAAGPAPAAKPRGRRGRWLWRWTKRLAIAGLILVIVARIALPFVLPSIVNSVLSAQGLSGHYEDLDISLVTGDIRLWHFELFPAPPEGSDAPPDPATRLAHLEYAHIDLDMSALLTLDLTVHRVEVDGLDVYLTREADGSLRWPEPPPSEPEEPTPEEPVEPEAPSEEPLRFESPVRLDALRVQHVRVHLADLSVEPAQQTWIEASVRVSNVGHPQFPAIAQLVVHSPDLLDQAHLDIEATTGEELHVDFSAAIQGFHPAAAAPWLAPLGIEGRAHALALRAGGRAQLTADAQRTIHAEVDLGGFAVTADGVPHAELDAIALTASIGEVLGIGRVTVDGVRARARRDADGTLEAAGLAFVPVPEAPAPAAGTAPSAPPAAAPSTDGPAEPATPWSLEGIAIAGIAVQFDDAAVSPPRQLALRLDTISVGGVDPARPAEATAITVRGALPRVAETLTVDATARPLAQDPRADATLSLSEITLAELTPYLEQAGLAPELESGTLSLGVAFRGTADGGIALAELRDLSLRDGDVEHLAFDGAALRGMTSTEAETHIQEIAVTGLRLPTRRDTEGLLHFAGLRTLPPTAPNAGDPNLQPQAAASTAAAAEPRPTAPDDNAPPAAPTRLRLDRVTVEGVQWAWDDRAVEPAVTLTSELRVELADLVLGGAPGSAPASPARLSVQGSVGEAVRELLLQGSITTRPGPLDIDADLALSAAALDWRPLQSYLTAAGVETTDETGTVTGRIRAKAQQGPSKLTAEATLSDLGVGPVDAPWVGVTAIEVRGVEVTDLRTTIDLVRIAEPTARLARDAQGAVLVAGLRLPSASPPAPQPAPTTAGDLENPALPAPAAPAPTSDPVAAEASATAPAATFSLRRLVLEGGSVRWQDAALEPAVDTALQFALSASDVDTAPGAPAATFEVSLTAAGDLERLALGGSSTLDPSAIEAQLTLVGEGLRSGPLAAYLPPGIEVTMTDGQLRGALTASLRTGDDGALAATVALADFGLTDGETSLLSLPQVRAHVPRIDFPGEGGTLSIDELALRGLEMNVANTPRGLEMLGLRFGPPAPVEGAPAGPTDPAAGTGDNPEAPAAVAAEASSSAAGAAGATQAPVLPTIALRLLDLEVRRITYRDDTGDAPATPVDLSLRVTNPEPWTLVDDDPEALPPLALQVRGAATPLVEALRADLTAAPWAGDPKFTLDLAATGVRGAELTKVLPSLAASMQGDDLTDGAFTATAEAVLDLRRRFPTDIDLSRGFGLELLVQDVHLRAVPDGEILVGFDTLAVEAPTIRPNRVHVKTAELSGIHGRVRIDEAGTHVAGLTLLPPPPLPEGAPPPAPPPPPPPAPPPPRPPPATEFRLDNLLVSGIDFELRDETSATPLVFPLTGLDIEVERFTTKAFTEPKPVSFSAVLTTGNVTLPKRTVASSLLAGVLTAAGHAITGGGDADATEERPFLEELSVQGRLQFYPDLEGRVRTSLTGLELTALRGPAQAAGVEIGDGVFDTGIDVRLEPGVVRTEASFGFADLSLDEPPGGLISTYLKLPAPLDAVLFALKDDVDEIHVPLTLEVGKEGVGGGAIASAAVSALGSIITDAIASAPLRAAGTLTGALGFGPGAAENLAARKRNVRFEPGAVELPPEAAARLLPLVDKIRGDDSLSLVLTHSFGVQDVVLAERLANPDRATTEQLVAGLRQRRAELQIRRDEAGAEARMHLLTGRHYLAQGEVARLRALDRTLAELEDALDDAIKLLRPGAERRAPRRTKTAALGLGNRRLDAMQAWLLEQLGPAAADRIEVRRARLGEPVGPLGGVVSVTPARRQTSGS